MKLMKLAQYTLEAKNKHQYFTIEAAAVDSERGSSIDSVQPTLCRLSDIAVKSSFRWKETSLASNVMLI